jgi:hypothetical protein
VCFLSWSVLVQSNGTEWEIAEATREEGAAAEAKRQKRKELARGRKAAADRQAAHKTQKVVHYILMAPRPTSANLRLQSFSFHVVIRVN